MFVESPLSLEIHKYRYNLHICTSSNIYLTDRYVHKIVVLRTLIVKLNKHVLSSVNANAS
jgi:hypothetical protein